MWSKGNSLALLVGMQICTATMKISAIVPQEDRIELPQGPAISFLDINPKDAPSYHKDCCSTMFISVLFITARNWKQSSCFPTED